MNRQSNDTNVDLTSNYSQYNSYFLRKKMSSKKVGNSSPTINALSLAQQMSTSETLQVVFSHIFRNKLYVSVGRVYGCALFFVDLTVAYCFLLLEGVLTAWCVVVCVGWMYLRNWYVPVCVSTSPRSRRLG